jgi:biotin carboxyl carrier protein
MEYRFNYLNKTHAIDLTKEKDGFRVSLGEDEYRVSDLDIKDNMMTFTARGELFRIYFARDKDNHYMSINGEIFTIESAQASKPGAKGISAQEENSVASPMPGLLVKLPVAVGDKVEAGVTLAIVEAMKMQNELRAQSDGVVKKINFKEGDQVDAFVPIVELEPTKNA